MRLLWTHLEYIYVTSHLQVDPTRWKLRSTPSHLEGTFGVTTHLEFGTDRGPQIQPFINSFCRVLFLLQGL